MTTKTIYIAGPMKGLPLFNFPAFDAAETSLRVQGWDVINPAELDREVGFDPAIGSTEADVTPTFLEGAMRRDVEAIMRADAIAMLPGWEKSTGAKAEMHLALWRHIPVYLFPQMIEITKEDVLDEAKRLTGGDRHDDYGDASVEFERVRKVWSALLGVEISLAMVPILMIALKCCRQVHKPKRDGWVDIGGYARCGAQCDE